MPNARSALPYALGFPPSTLAVELFHRRFIIKGDTSTHAQGTDLGGGLVERVNVRRHCAPLCSKLVAAVSGSICIAVVSVSVCVIVLSEQAVVVAEGVGLAGRVELPSYNADVDLELDTVKLGPAHSLGQVAYTVRVLHVAP